MDPGTGGKLSLDGPWVTVFPDQARATCVAILTGVGCPPATADQVAEHLLDSSLCGVASHGLWRVLQYAEDFESGKLDPRARPALAEAPGGGALVDGRGGIGIPAMLLASDALRDRARESGLAAIALRDLGHTGRLGAYGELLAVSGLLAIIVGGGGREAWRQVAPYGGRKAVLATNPYCIATPGGARGPVVVDFATSALAGGWIYAARNAGAQLPEGALIDKEGRPSRDPEDYYAGGAILPMGGAKGYGLSVAAEMIAEAMLGPSTTECQWLLIALDCRRYRAPTAMQTAAESVLAELRACPPADGFAGVEVPGERERAQRARSLTEGITLPEKTWEEILALARRVAGS